MSDVIQLLPDSVANQIAAGEVIQRPASVIKELVENAIDADAHNIQILVVDAGRTCIQVIDDGKGMSETDARLAFERHATSKIREAQDLFSLHTMGFRGEALASIAAVAQVELRTRLRGEDIGTHLSIAGCKVTGQEPCSCAEGSNFSVANLFYNVPARRKFLKSNTTELNNILAAFERIALVNPQVAFSVTSNQNEVFNLSASSLRKRICDIFGKRLDQDLLPVDVETTVCKITGFVGKPESAKKKGAHQYLFANERYMKHPYFHKAIMQAFERTVPEGEQVPYFLYITVEPETIDVNIHPTKTEIKFENEQAIWQILSAAVRDSVGRFCEVPSIDFDVEGAPEIPVFSSIGTQAGEQPRVHYDANYNPFHSGNTSPKHATQGWESLFPDVTEKPKEEQEAENIIADKSPQHYQYKGRYIMTAVKSGLMIIDQHRAHLRILYEEYQQSLLQRQGNTQRLLFPEVVQLPPSDEVMLQRILPDMQKVGFELTSLGGGAYAINGIPSGLDGLNPSQLVLDMLNTAMNKGCSVTEEVHNAIALSLARSAAVPVGQVLTNDEMEDVVNRLFVCTNVNKTPDGLDILSILQQTVIDEMF